MANSIQGALDGSNISTATNCVERAKLSWYVSVLRNYAVFSGRARRKEFWFFFLFDYVFLIALIVLDVVLGIYKEELGFGLLTGIYALSTLIPTLAVTVRRLHDTNRSGWWVLLVFVPPVGEVILLVFMILGGHASANRFGPDPISEA